MYILQNAMQNLTRNKGRNLMVAAIIFVIIVSCVTALMINNTAAGVIEDYKARFGSEVSIVPNMGRIMQSAGNTNRVMRPSIPAEQLLIFADSEYLLDSVLTARGRGTSENLKAIDEDKGGGGGPSLSGGGPAGAPQPRQYTFKLWANLYDDFTDGYRELTEGSRFPVNPGECLISRDLLVNSGLSVGDTVTINSDVDIPGGQPGEEAYYDISFSLTIVGTYIDMTDEYSAGMRENAYNNRRNEIYMFFDDLAAEVTEGMAGIGIDAKYYLKNPGMLAAFSAELYAKGLSEDFDVSTDEAGYNTVVSPVEGMKSISITFVIIVLVFGAIIIALLSSIAIRERKYEIGVLRAMGMKKSKVALGLWAETLAITMLCLVVGLGVGSLVAQPVANVLLEQQVEAAENAQSQNNRIPPGAMTTRSVMGVASGTTAESIKSIRIAVGFDTILQIVAIALLLSSLAGLISTQKITKYETIKILMERN